MSTAATAPAETDTVLAGIIDRRLPRFILRDENGVAMAGDLKSRDGAIAAVLEEVDHGSFQMHEIRSALRDRVNTEYTSDELAPVLTPALDWILA